ncbi:MAG: hypothetical protein QOH90_2226, partial [Actinomycetota bacterium]|nr:hypothetical protein [Actinomycetota bacterium]
MDTVNAARSSQTVRSRVVTRRRWVVGLALVVLVAVLALFLRPDQPPLPQEVAGSPAWALAHYGNPDARHFRDRHIVEIDFLGEPMYVNKNAKRHFLRLANIFEARAPEYAATIAGGETDDWSYFNRDIRGERSKSNHAFGIAIDINALQNVLGTAGDIPMEVVEEWRVEGGAWGGDFGRPDPMHFETHLTPREIKERYEPDG